MHPDHYKVDIVHYHNPHLIWVIVEKAGQESKFCFEQIGIYGILPLSIELDYGAGAVCEVKKDRSEQWVPASNKIVNEILLEAEEIWFSPTYIDKKISLFDDNTHKYGEIIVILHDGSEINIKEELLNSDFSHEDQCLFHKKLQEGKLNTRLQHGIAHDIVKKLEVGYKTRNISKDIWLNTLYKQISVFLELQRLETSMPHNAKSYDQKKMETLLKNKLNDLKLTKDVDEASAGRACKRQPRSVVNEGLRKKLDLLKRQKTHAINVKVFSPPSSETHGEDSKTGTESESEALKPNIFRSQKEAPKKSFGEDNKTGIESESEALKPNIYRNQKEALKKNSYEADHNFNKTRNKTGPSPKTPAVQQKTTPTIAFGPAGMNRSKFVIKARPAQEQEIKENRTEQKLAKKKEEDFFEVEEKNPDAYAKTDSEVNIRISNLDILNKIRAKNMLAKPIVPKIVTVEHNSKTEPINAKKNNKFKYIESKLNVSLSSNSDKDSSKVDFDSDDESISAVEEKLDLKKYTKKVLESKTDAEAFENVKNNVNPFRNIDGSISVFVDKLVSPILMVHTKKNNRIHTVSNLRDIPFGTNIHRVLKNMSIEKPMRPQTVSWPTILRGHSFFCIGPHESGNTMGYLPAVCRLVSDFKNTPDHFGLSCIIVCGTSHSVTAVEASCKMFLDSAKIFACFAGISDMTITTTLLNGVDLLICTPRMLVRLIKEDFSLDFRGLCTFVVDDCEHVSKVYPNELKFSLLKVKEVVKSRANKEWKVQYVFVSRLWCDFMSSLAKKAPDSVVCISAFEECVLYSKANTSVEFAIHEKKLNAVINFMEAIDKSKKSVIVCREDNEVKILEKALTKLKFVVFACDSTMTVHDLYNLDKTLRDYQEPVSGPVLVCCDGNLTHLNVTDAHYLVHFSLPILFSMFCKRFAVLIDNYPSIFKEENPNIKIKILLDDTNVEQLPKILHFIKRCTNEVPDVLDAVSTTVLTEKDLKKAQNLVPICNKLLTLGQCPDYWNCTQRHAVFKEYDEPRPWMPKEGVITFQILHYHSAVYYSARLTSCITKNNTVKYPQSYNLLSLKLGMYYSKEQNRRLHGIPKIGDICAVTVKNNLFVRCQVVKIIKYVNDIPNIVRIKLIDEERYEIARDTQLHHLPDELKSIESHVVVVILSNIMPEDKDVTYSKLAKYQLKKITDENDDLYMRGQISLVVGNCIFVDTLEACQELSALEEVVVKHDFKKELLDVHARPNPEHILTIKKLCGVEESNSEIVEEIVTPEIVENPKQIPKPIKTLPKGRWAHLDSSGFSTVFFMAADDPCQFFIRPIKFDTCLTTLIKDIKAYVTENPEPLEEFTEGDIVLAEFPDDATYERARIDGVLGNNKVKCFFVDQADWRDVVITKLRAINEKFLTVLPFQAIECRLVGIKPVGDSWTDFSTNFFVDSCFSTGDTFKQLYCKYFTKEKANVTDGHKYGVVLIDTYSEDDIIINQMMIDMNLAAENEEIHCLSNLDFKRDSSSTDSDIEIWTEKELAAPVFEDKNTETKPTDDSQSQPPGRLIRSKPLVDSDDSMEDFEFVPDTSGKWGDVPVSQIVSIKELSDSEAKEIERKQQRVVCKPKVLWRQNTNYVIVKIKLILDEYKVEIKERHVEFSAEVNDTKYGFEIELFGIIDRLKSSHANKGQYIQIKLWKFMSRNWLTLTRNSDVPKWIAYDLENIDVSSDEESNVSAIDMKKYIHHSDDDDSDDEFQDDSCFSYKKE